MLLFEKRAKRILRRSGINLVLSFFLLILLMPGFGISNPFLLFLSLLLIYLFFSFVSAASHLASFLVLRTRFSKSTRILLFILVPVNIFIAVVSLPLLYFALQMLLAEKHGFLVSLPDFIVFFGRYAPVAAVVSFLITFLTTKLQGQGSKNRKKDTQSTKPAAPSETSLLTIKVGDDYIPLRHREILYLSAHGNRTVIHTMEREYETPLRLADLEKRLNPKLFLRIHRSCIVNLNAISRIQYNAGGSYIAFLNDSEETNLPAGRTYAPELRRRLGL